MDTQPQTPRVRLGIVAEPLCEAVDLRPAQKVLDVATGSGNAEAHGSDGMMANTKRLMQMEKVAVLVLAGREIRADETPIANALTTVNEFKEAGDEVTLIFSGAGTR